MSAPETLAPDQGADLPSVVVLVDGSEIEPRWGLLSAVVTHEVNRIPLARISFVDGDVATGEFELSDEDLFVPGKSVEIRAGYHEDCEPIFQGVVVRHGLRSLRSQTSTLTVVCKDSAVKLTVGKNSRYFYEVPDSDAMDEVIADSGLGADIEATENTHQELVQYQCTDWDWIVSRAEANAMLVTVKDGTVTVKPPDLGAEPALTLAYGATIIEFEAEVDAEAQLDTITTKAWSPADQEPAESVGEAPDMPEQGNLSASDLAGALSDRTHTVHNAGAIDPGELDAWSQGLALRSRLAAIRGRVRCQGTVAVEVGSIIGLEKVGKRFNGNAFVSAVRHEITPNNWVTDIQFGLDHKWLHQRHAVAAPAAAGVLPPIPGVHVGKVTKLEGDPAGEERIQVKLPLIDAKADGVWSRICTLDAGNERGTFFRPEVDDEVIVAFLHGDPRQPVVLGMMHSSALPAPLTTEEANPQKGYQSRSKITWIFDDDKVWIKTEMPSGRVMVLDDDTGEIRLEGDDHKVVINGDGVSVESAGDIVLEASGDLKMKAGGNAELKASGDATIKGSQVKVN